MGCKISKPSRDPCTIIISFPNSCGRMLRSFPSPTHLVDGEHDLKNPTIDQFHLVSLTSSTYGSLRLDALEDHGRERSRRGSSDSLGDMISENIKNSVILPTTKVLHSCSQESGPLLTTFDRSKNNENVKPMKAANTNSVEIINMWELMEGIEDEKAALKMLRGLVERPRMLAGNGREKSPPPTSAAIRTIEDVDNVLDRRKSLPSDHRFRRGSSLVAAVPVHQEHESRLNSDRMFGKASAMLQKRRARAMQISKDVISELDHLRRINLSQSQEFNTSRRNIVSRSQEFNFVGRRNLSLSHEFNSTGRRDMSRSQEFSAGAMRNLSQSQDFNSIGRFKYIKSPDLDPLRKGSLSRNQQHDSRMTVHDVRSQESARPPMGKLIEDVATSHSRHEISRTDQIQNEKVVAVSKPDIVLRSPMLTGVQGHEKQKVRPGHNLFTPSAAISIESTNKPVAQLGEPLRSLEEMVAIPGIEDIAPDAMAVHPPAAVVVSVCKSAFAKVSNQSNLGDGASSSVGWPVSWRCPKQVICKANILYYGNGKVRAISDIC